MTVVRFHCQVKDNMDFWGQLQSNKMHRMLIAIMFFRYLQHWRVCTKTADKQSIVLLGPDTDKGPHPVQMNM